MGIGLTELIVFLAFILFGTVGTIFWIWALVDCVQIEPSNSRDKLIWVLIILFTHWIGALLYLLIRRPHRKNR